MTIMIQPGNHTNGEAYFAVGPIAFRTHGEAMSFLLDVLESL